MAPDHDNLSPDRHDVGDPLHQLVAGKSARDEDCHAAAGNALKHGLTSTTVLPAALKLAVGDHLVRLRCELRPTSHLQELLVREIARHAAALDFCEAAEQSALKVGALANSTLDSALNLHTMDEQDAALTAAVSNQVTDRLCRYRRAHERGFYAALDRLQALQEEDNRSSTDGFVERFRHEANCELYLFNRIHSRHWRCPRCAHARGHWLTTRARWQCVACGRQIGLRGGTIMEHSPLPLTTWFRAIATVTVDLSISPSSFQEHVGIGRSATARRMLSKIRSALHSPHADRLLAGLHRVAGQRISSDLDVELDRVLQNGIVSAG